MSLTSGFKKEAREALAFSVEAVHHTPDQVYAVVNAEIDEIGVD